MMMMMCTTTTTQQQRNNITAIFSDSTDKPLPRTITHPDRNSRKQLVSGVMVRASVRFNLWFVGGCSGRSCGVIIVRQGCPWFDFFYYLLRLFSLSSLIQYYYNSVLLTIYTAKVIMVPRRIIWSWYTGGWSFMGGLLHLIQREGGRVEPQPAQSSYRCTVPNVTAHPSTPSVPITVLLCNGLLLCGFNVLTKRLILHTTWAYWRLVLVYASHTVQFFVLLMTIRLI